MLNGKEIDEVLYYAKKVLPNKSEFGKKAYTAKAEIGKWYKFDGTSQAYTSYGKIVEFESQDVVKIEKVFELPNDRPYATESWFDRLPWAIKE